MSNTENPNGVYRKFVWRCEQQVYILGSIVMALWLLQFCRALSQYTLIWTAQLWYFTPKKTALRNCCIFRGYGNALRFHSGTLVLGSLLCALNQCLGPALGCISR